MRHFSTRPLLEMLCRATLARRYRAADTPVQRGCARVVSSVGLQSSAAGRNDDPRLPQESDCLLSYIYIYNFYIHPELSIGNCRSGLRKGAVLL